MPDKPLIKLFLFPLSLLYGCVIFFRNKLYDSGILHSYEFNLPIISVGNLHVGGTGKTPVIEYLAQLLMHDNKVAVLSRGYKRKTKGFILADKHSTPHEIGDEPCQIKARYPDINVAVCESRVTGVKTLLNIHPDIDVILLDDAYQHRQIKPGLSILLMDFNSPATNDWLLPFGRLREPVSGIKRANLILITKCPEKLKPIERRIIIKELELPPYQNLFFTSIEYENITPVFPEYEKPDPEILKQEKPDIILLTGIANPRPVKRFARSISTNITEMGYPDHYDYKENDVKKITETFNNLPGKSKIVLTTWKDAVRLKEIKSIPEEIKKVLFFVPIRISFLNEDHINFSKQIINYVKENNRNSILYKGKNKF